MSFLDGIKIKGAGSTPATGKAPANNSTQTQTQDGGFLGGIKIGKKSSTPAPTQQDYFATTTPNGSTMGPSQQKDTSGKPFLDYRNPGDTSTTTDKTRVDTPFDPRVAEPHTLDTFYNPRAVEARAQLKTAMGGSYNDELDHVIALELSGSNDKSNLQIEPHVSGTQNTATDPLENSLAKDVASGKISLFDAQTKLSQAKGKPTPWVGNAPKTNSFGAFINKVKDVWTKSVAPAIESVTARPQDETQAIQNGTSYHIDPKTGHKIYDKVKIPGMSDFVASSFAENIPFGAGKALQATRDAGGLDVTAGDWMSGVKTVPKTAVQSVANMIATPVLNVAGAVKQSSNMGDSAISFNIPGIGKVSNRQYNAAQRIAAGEDPVSVGLEEGSGSILDTLFLASMIGGLFTPRETVTNSFKGDVNNPAINAGKTLTEEAGGQGGANYSPKSFRLYTAPVASKALSPNDISAMESQGVDFGKNYDPSLPTFFRVKATGEGGGVSGEIVQLKPSYFDMVANKIGGTDAVSSYFKTSIENSQAMNVDHAIEAGDIPKDAVYQSDGKTLQPDFAQGRIDDIAQKLDQFKAGLGDQYRKSIDVQDTSMEELISKGEEILKTPANSVLPKNPQIANQIIASTLSKLPPGATTKIYSKESNINDVKNSILKPEAPAIPKKAQPIQADNIFKDLQPAQDTTLTPQEKNDWNTNFSEKYGKLSADFLKTTSEFKNAKGKNLKILQKRLSEITKEQAIIVSDFIEKWSEPIPASELSTENQQNTNTSVMSNSKSSLGIEDLKKVYAKSGPSSVDGFSKADEVLSNIMTELQLARPGSRLFKGYGKDTEVTSIPSTFPDWIPEQYRSSELIGKIMPHIENGIEGLSYPPATRPAQRRFVDAVLDIVDQEVGIDTKSIRNNIINKNENTKNQGATSVTSGGTERGSELSLEEIANQFAGKDGGYTGPKESTITLNSGLDPGLGKTLEQDIIPKGKALAQGAKTAFNEVATFFNPIGQAPTEAVDILMKRKGDFEREVFRAESTMKKIKKMWDKQPPKARLDFMHRVETGAEIPAEYKSLADLYRQRLDNAYNAINEFKDIPFINNFFPHFWEKPGIIETNLMPKIFAKRPLQGPRTFLKKRVFTSIQEGVDLGYKPVSTNPEELMQIYETNVKKFIMAQKIKEDMIEKGFWKFVRGGEKIPENYRKIDDGIAKIYYKPEEGNVAMSGEYYAQKDVARLINNYLSKDYLYDTALGRGAMNLKNTLNAFQLGFSAFHLSMETLDSVVSQFSIGMSKVMSGHPIEGAIAMFKAPAAPYIFFRDGQKFFNNDPHLMDIEKSIFTGGASFREKQYYKNTVLDKFMTNIREGNYLGALFRLPMSAIEATMRPLFSYYIPRLKVGAFRSLYASELERLSKKISAGQVSQETVARKTWANIENRMGELNYDNLFWHRGLKSSLMLTFRAVGWNLGTIREIGGALLQDIPTNIARMFTKEGRQRFEFTPKMSYTLSLFTVLGFIGAIYQYLHTGKKPESLKDLYYPRNGAKDKNGQDYRIEFPTYLKDMYQSTNSPIQTVVNKFAPEFTLTLDLLKNKDFFGDYIRNANDNTPTQIKQVALYLMTQLTPFTTQQLGQLNKTDASMEQKIEAFFGIMKAPQALIDSAYKTELNQAYQDTVRASGPRTPEQKNIDNLKAQAREEIKNEDYTTLDMLVEQGILTERGRATFIKNAQLTPAERMYKGLPKTKKAQLEPLKNQTQ